MSINVYTLSNAELDRQLEARHSRTHGTRGQKEDRLIRFMEHEDQKQRRRNAVAEARENARENYQNALNNAAQRILNDAFDLEYDETANILMDLRNHPDGVSDRIARLEDDNARLNRIVDTLERRIVELEIADMPPLTPLQDSNPNWIYTDDHIEWDNRRD